MAKITDKKKKAMLTLIKQGKSLKSISRAIGLNKTTVYYHFRKYRGIKFKQPNINKNNLEHLGEFLGAFAGDGYANFEKTYNYRIRIFLNYTEGRYAEELSNVLESLLSKRPKIMHYRSCIVLLINSKKVFDLLHSYLRWDKKGHRSKSRSISLTRTENKKSFKIGFLRGSLDTDGHIGKDRIVFSTSSEALCRNLEKFLLDVGMNFRTYSYQDKRPNRSLMYHIKIDNHQRERFLNLIKPHNLKIGAP